jgi:hypothetical protein
MGVVMVGEGVGRILLFSRMAVKFTTSYRHAAFHARGHGVSMKNDVMIQAV